MSTSNDDVAAFLAANQMRLSRLAVVLAGGVQDAEDLVQDTMLKVVRKWSAVSRSNDRSAYACRIMINQWRDERRRVGRREDRERIVAVTETAVEEQDLAVLDRVTLREAMSALTSKQRAVLHLRFIEDLPVREVADALGCSEGTVKSQTHHALRALSALEAYSTESPGR